MYEKGMTEKERKKGRARQNELPRLKGNNHRFSLSVVREKGALQGPQNDSMKRTCCDCHRNLYLPVPLTDHFNRSSFFASTEPL